MAKHVTDFELLRLKSERMRAIGMLLVLAVVGSNSIYHFVDPAGNFNVGITIVIASLFFAALETVFLFIVQKAIQLKKQVTDGLRYFEAFLESVLPVLAMGILMDVSDKPFSILLSPAYALIIIIIAASSLRLSPRLTLITGIISSTCYTLLVLRVLQVDSTLHLSPHPTNLYINMAIMLFVATLVMTFITKQLRSYVDAAVQEMAFQNELELASQVQNNLLPLPLPDMPGYELSAFNKPAMHTGGDYYDCVKPDPDLAVLMIADVTGHGVGPALLTASSRAYFRAILEQHQNIVEIIQQANRLLNVDLYGGQFVTLATLMLDIKKHRVKYISAGHGSTLLFHQADGVVDELPAQSIPLGIDVPLKLESVLEFEMQPGDIVVMLSDGCYECKNPAGEQYSLERIIELIKQHQVRPVNDIAMIYQADVKEYMASQPQADDMTMLILKRQD